jgi:hypothetical protein
VSSTTPAPPQILVSIDDDSGGIRRTRDSGAGALRFIAKEMVQLRKRHGRFVINAGGFV